MLAVQLGSEAQVPYLGEGGPLPRLAMPFGHRLGKSHHKPQPDRRVPRLSLSANSKVQSQLL